MKDKIISAIKNLVFFLLVIFLTYHVVFKNNDMGQIVETLKTIDIKYILLGICCMLTYLLLDATNTRRVINSLNNKISIFKAYKYSMINFFFSSITPSSTGGQPMQMYYMDKDKIKLSHSTISCLVNLACFQLVSITLTVTAIIIKADFIFTSLPAIRILLFIGLIANSCILFFCLAALFSKKMIVHIVKFITNLLKFFHFKNADKVNKKLLDQVNDYKECASYLKDHKSVLAKNVVTSTFQLILFHSVPFFVSRAFGLTNNTYITFLAVETILYMATSALPTPGAVGVSELEFMVLYKILFPEALLSSAMLLSRGISFYFLVLVCGLYIIIDYIYHQIKK